MSNRRRRTLLVIAALAVATVVGPVPAQAAPSASPVIAAIQLPVGGIDLDEVTVGPDVWTLTGDPETGHLFRIDPATNGITARLDLPSGSPGGDTEYEGALTYAFGSLWVAETFRDQVFRIDPATATVVARIGTGRYPALLTAGAGSIWVAQGEAGSVARLDPNTNRVVDTIPVGQQDGGHDEPAAVSYDAYTGTVLVTLSATHRVAEIHPRTRRVDTYSIAPAQGCGRAVPIPTGFWIDDTPCSSDMFRWDSATGQVSAHIVTDPRDRLDYGLVVRGNVMYTGEAACGAQGCQGAVVKRDALAGAVLSRIRTPSSAAYLPALAAGDLWATTFGDAVLVHLRAF